MDKDAFAKKMTDILNFGALNLAMGIGYKTGLFDAMDTFDAPQPVSLIAEKSGLSGRYVREWLGIMTSGGITECAKNEEGENQFYLPKAHGDLITRRAGNANLGVYTQEIPLLTQCAMAAVEEGFSTCQGVTYDHYPKFQSFMSELANAKHRQVLVDTFLPSVDNGNMLTRLRRGIRVCDLGCAEGVAVMLMAEAFPRSRFTGIDISEDAIEAARAEAERRSLGNASFLLRDAALLTADASLKETVDYVTAFDAIHDQTRPLDALRGVHHMLGPGGIFSMIDIAARSDLADNVDHPMAPFLYTVSLMHCMPVGLVDNGSGLGMMWGREKALDMLSEAGFENPEVFEIPEDSFNLHFLCKK
ncbi:MAG: methyltransferase type 12 [Desulfobacteraceae bacterium 4572_88]|nr:MAG: methyltransferase type 12 [Desulfobacteraceae bacterium 4572_88]